MSGVDRVRLGPDAGAEKLDHAIKGLIEVMGMRVTIARFEM